jgi:hypothetical protein
VLRLVQGLSQLSWQTTESKTVRLENLQNHHRRQLSHIVMCVGMS